jgi:hypothetical protein
MRRFAAILCAAGLLAGCATDPLKEVPRLSETDVGEADIQAAIRAEPEDVTGSEPAAPQRGLFGQIFGISDAPSASPVVLPDAETTAAETTSDAEVVEVTANAPEPPRRGLLGFLQRAADDARANEDGIVDLAAVPQTESNDAATSPGLFGGKTGAPQEGDPDFKTVPLGTTLPYGTLARVCNVRPGQLGRRVERYPEGRGMYALYDSDPGNTAPHTYYVTGFKDGCVRQFTAALALFGSTETHEQLRYGLPATVQPYSTTDAAYERLKSRICRVGRGESCGSALPRLSRNTVFVSVYERFGSNPIWKTILIHDGEVIETDIRGNG